MGWRYLVLAALGLGLQAQEAEVVFRSETVLIEIEVRATDRQRAAVADLAAQEFRLTENGERREIASFEYVQPVVRGAGAAVSPLEKGVALPNREPVRIYIETRISAAQAPRVYRSIREFLEELPVGAALISLRGMDFTDDRDLLLANLEKMYRGASAAGVPALIDVESGAVDTELANIAKWTGIFTPVVMKQPAPQDHTRRVALEAGILQKWIRLTQQMGAFPGKKMVVVFGRGMRYDSENVLLLDRFSEEAVRSRVQFHTIDVRGLVATVWGGDSTSGNPHYDPTLSDRAFNREDLAFSQSGSRMLADLTGGTAVFDNNDMAAVFEPVYENLGGYYLLGFRPGDAGGKDHSHRLKVETTRPDVRLDYVKAYREEPGFGDLTQAQKRRKLEFSAASEEVFNEIAIDVGHEIFLTPEGKTQIAFSAGIPFRALPASGGGKTRQVEYAVLALAQDVDGERPAEVARQEVKLTLAEQELDALRKDASAYLQFPNRLDLAPGAYRWKIVVRDELTGSMGSYQATLDVPAFDEPGAPSSLMLTTRVAQAGAGGKKRAEGEARGIEVGDFRFLAEAGGVFRQGKILYVVYGVYNLSDEQLSEPYQPRVFLALDGALVEQPPFEAWQGFLDTAGRRTHVVARFNTAGLKAGEYQLSVALPDGRQALTRGFSITDGP